MEVILAMTPLLQTLKTLNVPIKQCKLDLKLSIPQVKATLQVPYTKNLIPKYIIAMLHSSALRIPQNESDTRSKPSSDGVLLHM
jgi:hypothetical protein